MKIIDNLFPGFALGRLYKKAALQEAKRNYEAAKKDRLSGDWVPTNGTAEQMDAPYRDLLRARARDLERNSELGEAVLDALLRNVVGTGIKPQAKIKNRNGELEEKLNDRVENRFKEWVKNCDLTGHQNFYEIQELVLRREIVDGEILIKHVINNSKSKERYQLQLIEADSLSENHIKLNKGSNYILSGVEINGFYKPLAYHLQSIKPDGFSSFDSKRIPADDIIHIFHKTRVSQVRGISKLAKSIKRIKSTDDYLEAELIARRIAASFAGFVTQIGERDKFGRTTDNEGNTLTKISPGTIKYLKPGEDIRFANPSGNSDSVKNYMEIQKQIMAAGTGQSYEVVSRDMSKSNYSSARQNHLEDRKTWQKVQGHLISHLCVPVWEKFIDILELEGFFDDRDIDKNTLYKSDWIAPGWSWIDPLKESKADEIALKLGMKTLADIAAAQGKDWQEVAQQRAVEQKYMKKLGIEGGENSAKK